MAVLTQVSQCTGARQTFLPLLISSFQYFKHVIYWCTAQKSQHFSVRVHCFPGRDDGFREQGGDYSVTKPHIVYLGKYQSFSLS